MGELEERRELLRSIANVKDKPRMCPGEEAALLRMWQALRDNLQRIGRPLSSSETTKKGGDA